LVDRKVRWGVLSTANIGRSAVIPAIQHSSNGDLVSIASRNPNKARDFARDIGIPQSYGSYDALVSADDIDAVYIPLPNSMHAEWTIKAAERGKHVLCEKPLAMNADECARIETAADQNDVKVMEAFMYRFHPRTQRVIELARSQVVGETRFIHSEFTIRITDTANIRLQTALGGGALMDVGCYCVNTSRMIAAQEPFEVQAYPNWGPTGVDEQMVANLRFASGLLAQFDCALTLSHRESYQIVGSEGVLDVPVAFVPGTNETVIRQTQGGKETLHRFAGDDEYRLMVEHFAQCVLTDQQPRYPPADGIANMRIIDALYRSARTGGQPQRLSAI
jgi:predicted dehydrogenase